MDKLTSVFRLEFRSQRRSTHTVAVVGALLLFYVFWLSHSMRVTPPRATSRGTMTYFRVAGHYDLVVIDFARDPFMLLFVVFVPLLLGATTITSGRRSGTLRTLQSLPYRRRTVFAGLLLARVAVMNVVVCLLMGVTLLEAWRQGFAVSPLLFARYTVVLLAVTGALVAVGAAFSSLATRRARANSLCVGFGFAVIFSYNPLQTFLPEALLLTPRAAYYALVAGIDSDWYTLFQDTYVQTPLYYSTAIAALSVLAWLGGATYVGLRLYNGEDITTES